MTLVQKMYEVFFGVVVYLCRRIKDANILAIKHIFIVSAYSMHFKQR